MTDRVTRQLAENALKHLCGRMGVTYTTQTEPIEGAWFLDASRSRGDIAEWIRSDGGTVTCLGHPLGGYGRNLTFSQVYDLCWFTERCFSVREEMAR